MARRTVVALTCVLALLALVACSDDPDVTAGRSESVDTETADDTGAGGAPDESIEPPFGEPSVDTNPEPGDDGTAPPVTAPSTPAPSRPGSDGVGDPLWPDLGNPGIDVLHYDLDLSYDPETETIAGSVTLEVQATEDRDSFTLDSVGPDVTGVTVRGEPADFSVDSPELRITPTDPLDDDEDPIEVVVEYSAIPDPSNSSAGIPNGWFHTGVGSYVLNQPDGARSWVPSNDHPSDKATWQFTITVPPTLTAVANGRLVDHTTTARGETWVWREDLPMATYMIQVITGDYEIIEGEGPGGLPLVSAVLREDRAAMQQFIDITDDQIEFFERYFGPYPLDRYGIAITDSFSGLAMETFGRSLFSRKDFDGSSPELEQLFLSHELAHMWFGDAVTPAEWGDIWLSESFATYGEWMWTDHYGFGDLEIRAEDALANRQFGSGDPTGSPSTEQMFAYNSYDGGAVVLHALRLTVGDDTFFEILRTWAADNDGTSRYTDDFIATAEEVSGEDLEAFFDDWLFADVLPPAFPA